MKDPVFIVGPHRSGSTLWHNLISISPGVFRLTEPRFLTRPGQKDFADFLKNEVNGLATDRDVERMVELCFSRTAPPGLESAFWRFEGIEAADDPGMRKQVETRVKESGRSLGEVARIILEEITRASGYSRACVKFPVDAGHIPQLFEWFPDCRVVHITRDPRALAVSKSNDPSGTAIRIREHPSISWLIKKQMVLLEIAQYWWTGRLHLRYERFPNYRLFHYEDLLSEPRATLMDLCEFADLEFQEEMLEPQTGRHEHQPSSITGKRQKAFDTAAATRWREVISPFDAWLVSKLTRSSMKNLGYNPEEHPIFKASSDG